MNRKLIRNILFCFCLSALFSAPGFVFASTDVVGNIVTDTTWTVVDSPYIVRDRITVLDGVTLTINPGVVVKFADDTRIEVNGALRALGTLAEPIDISSIHDDVVGGDTEDNGMDIVPSPFDGWFIKFFGAEPSIFTYARIRYAEGMYVNTSEVSFENATVTDGLYGISAETSVLSISHSFFFDFEWGGISGYASDVSFRNSTMRNVYDGDAFGFYSRSVFTFASSTIEHVDFGTAVALYDASAGEIFAGVIQDGEIGIELYSGSFLTLMDTTVKDCEDYGIEFYRSEVAGSGNTIRENGIGIYAGGKITLTDSIIADNVRYGVYGSSENVDVRGNWWGDASGPYHAGANPGGLGDEVYGNALFEPWLLEEPSDEPPPPPAECCSNVVFIPGLQATRLDLGGNRLWEPNSPADTPTLFLDIFGEPIIPNVATDGVIDEAFGFNIYKSFIEFMNTDMVGAGIIEKWMTFPYDWRFNPKDIVERGILLKDGSAYWMATELEELAASSKTGKVTLIAHSNGGLVAKELISLLEEEGKADLVDKLILVASPQLGTPKALAGMLHGDEQTIPSKIGVVLTKESARELAENMSSAYSLLPSKKYVSEVFDPVIEFDPEVAEIYNFPALYGDSIDSRKELDSFLLGDNDIRLEPSSFNTDEPNVLGKNLLREATSTQDMLDVWTAPAGVKVIQIAGWGIDTIRGIRYDNCDIPFCPDTLNHMNRELLLVHDGDGTVVIPSAVAMEGAETYYVNLERYNDENLFNRNHADILEIESMPFLLKAFIEENFSALPNYISLIKPAVQDEEKRLRFRIHSPVSLDLYDGEGNHTGLIQNPDSDLQGIEQQIPNSYYLEFGETKYAGADTVGTTTVVLVGQATGTFTFEIDEVLGDVVVASTTFSDIPVIKGTHATSDMQHVGGATTLSLDMDADGKIDAVIKSGEGISIDELLGILRGMVRSLNLADKKEQKLLKKIDKLEKALEKEFKNENNQKMEMAEVFEKLESLIEKLVKKGQLSKEDAQELLHIIEQIKVGVVE